MLALAYQDYSSGGDWIIWVSKLTSFLSFSLHVGIMVILLLSFWASKKSGYIFLLIAYMGARFFGVINDLIYNQIFPPSPPEEGPLPFDSIYIDIPIFDALIFTGLYYLLRRELIDRKNKTSGSMNQTLDD